MASRWITNLESTEHCAALVSNAEAALKAARSPAEINAAKATLERAKFINADVRNTYAQIRAAHGEIEILDPHPTPQRTADEIKAQGIVGLYKPGAGTGPAQYGQTITIEGVDG